MHSPKLAIIGCGAAAKRYYVPALKRHPGIIDRLRLVDQNRSQAEELVAQMGGGSAHSDLLEILGEVDGAIILLPHFLHAQVAGKFLEAGIPVLCEKPLAESGNEATTLNELASNTGTPLCVNNTRRMFPSMIEAKRLIDNGIIGEVQSIYYQEGVAFAWPSATGFYVNPTVSSKGVLLDVGSHVLDLVCWWLGTKPKLESFQDDSFGGPESVVQCSMHSNGCKIEIFLNRLTEIDSYFRIQGSTGRIEGRVFDWNRLTVTNKLGHERVSRLQPKVTAYPDFILPIVDNFLRVIAKAESPLVTGEDVAPSIELMDECYQNRRRYRLPWYAIGKTPVQKPGRVLVTGATGFIGARIVEHLHLSGERQVRAGIHQWSSAARLGRFPVDIAVMDLMNREQIQKSLEGVTHIIHCAKGPRGVTEDGTRNLVEVAMENGVERFVHLSTTEVYGDVSGEITEEAAFQYTGNEYNRTKIEAEKACWEYHKKGLPLVVLRPSIVYGPFSGNWTIHYARMLLEGIWGEYERLGEGSCNLIYVDDLVRAALLALNHEKAVGQAFNINGPEIITWNEYFRRFNQTLGLPPMRKIKASRAGLKTSLMLPVRMAGKIVKNHFMGPVKKLSEKSAIAKTILKKVENSLATTPVADELKLFSRETSFSDQKFQDTTGYRPEVAINYGLEQTKQWLLHMKVINKG